MYLNFLWSLLRHKWFVFVECCRLGIPWLGVIHDWTKFSPSEFIPYARWFYGGQREDKAAFDVAWLHHQKRNRHHWQYWLLVNDDGHYITDPYSKYWTMSMPDRYRREMLADWRGAGRSYGNPDTTAWYKANRRNIILHFETRAWVEAELL